MIRIKKRISSGYINESFEDRSSLHRGAPVKSLVKTKKEKSGRDDRGRISIRHRGAGAKRKYRLVSSLDEFIGMKAEVIRKEYDPNRSAYLILVKFENGQLRYLIAPEQVKIGDKISASDSVDAEAGNRSQLKNLPVGSQVSDIELYPGSMSHLARSAGVYATLMAMDKDYALMKLPSGELRRVSGECYASFGQVSNPDHSNIRIGRAGRKRRMGIRPSVRGKVMSPRAHPHGGGEGVNPIGLKYPKTPWGKIAIGKKTRKAKNSDKFIIKKRSAK